MYGENFQYPNYLTLFPIDLLVGWDALQNEPNFMFMRYSIAELLMVFEVSTQCEYTT